jgi:hypothetical protein
MLSKTWAKIQDAFGGINPFYYQWQLPVLNFILSSEHVSENYG